jgi:hypothetical protein
VTDSEIAKHAVEFRDGLAKALSENIAEVLKKDAEKVDQAYARLTCLQALRLHLLNERVSAGSLGFFAEAQGDGLTSQVLALSGSTRSALKSLRSLIENVIRSVYYADHPVEYTLWEAGKHRPTFKSLFDYLDCHPDLAGVDAALQPQTTLHANWKKLSQAVHASAKSDRMNDEAEKVTIWKTTQESVGNWAKFQKNVIKDICLLYVCLFKESLQGASLKPLRESLAIAIPATLDAKILADFKVRIVRAAAG